MEKKRGRWGIWLIAGLCLIIAAALAYKWQRVFFAVCTGDIFSDVPAHIKLAPGRNDYGLASYLIRALYALGDERFAQTWLSVCMTANNVLGIVTVWALIKKLLPKLNGWYALLASELALLCGPWIIPGYQTGIYMGAYNGNLYHNMTVLFSRTLIPLCLLFFFNCWDKRHERIRLRDWLGMAVCLLIVTMFKPNFAFAFIPLLAALLLYDFIKNKARFLKNELILGCAVLPAGFTCIWQYAVLFDDNFAGTSSSVALRLVLGAELLAVLIMYLRSLLLPLYTLSLQAHREESRGQIALIVAIEAIALVEATVFIETGFRATDGNFDWGGLAMYPVVFALSIGLLFRMIQDSKRNKPLDVFKCLLGLVFLLGHLVIGIYFLYYFSTGASYLI